VPLQSDDVGLRNGSWRGPLNTPHVQPTGSSETSGLIPGVTPPSLPPTQPAMTGRGIVGAFVKICQRWHLSPNEQVVLLGYRGSEFLGRQILEGNILTPSQDVRDRATYILTISVGLGALFDDAQGAELAWLDAPRDDLNARSPLAYMLEGRMANVIEVAMMVNRERGM
jgi:hypothetical protein